MGGVYQARITYGIGEWKITRGEDKNGIGDEQWGSGLIALVPATPTLSIFNIRPVTLRETKLLENCLPPPTNFANVPEALSHCNRNLNISLDVSNHCK